MLVKKLLVVLALSAGLVSPAAAQRKPPVKAPAKIAAGIPAALLAVGKSVYAQNCLTCHQADGLGVDGLNPPLVKNDYVLGGKPRLVKVLLNGLQGVDINGEQYHNVMPAQELTDAQMAAVLTYVRNAFGNKASSVSVAEVKAVRATNKK